jgi:hypothetical protein
MVEVEPPRTPWKAIGAFLGVVLVIAGVIVVVLVMTVYKVADSTVDSSTQLSPGARSEIGRADCAELSTLYSMYAPNGDSVEPDITALRLTRERQAKLGCRPSVPS